KKTSEYEMPEELEQEFENDSDFKTAFYNLTPGRQRGYLLYFSEAKQSKTRSSRIEKAKPKIFDGKGHNER
ncbi:MAG: YdeI/OmpD-associated family protein, partial [Bacteroidetes bacterium]|nr:YdeI/OmpD-associated family protein [Bacteroidota bacterium]